MTFTYNFDDNFEFLDEKSDPLTSIGEFDLISSQNLEQSLQTDWIAGGKDWFYSKFFYWAQ